MDNNCKKNKWVTIVEETNGDLWMGQVEESGWIDIMSIWGNGVVHQLKIPSATAETIAHWLHYAALEAEKLARRISALEDNP